MVFSRAQREKRYVQHRIREVPDLITDELVSQDAHVYICGQAKSFPAAVDSSLSFCLTESLGFTASEASEFLQQRKSAGYFHTECW